MDTPFHVTRPFGQEFDLDKSAEESLKSSRLIASKPEFRPTKEWQAEFAKRLEQLSSPFGSDKYGVESAWLADLPR